MQSENDICMGMYRILFVGYIICGGCLSGWLMIMVIIAFDYICVQAKESEQLWISNRRPNCHKLCQKI